MRLPEEGLGRGANRVTASDLAERAERADILAGMQVRSPVAAQHCKYSQKSRGGEEFQPRGVGFRR